MAAEKSALRKESVKGADCAPDTDALSHNLLGQRLGRKGRGTRERILAATQKLLAGPPDVPISLSAVAREASLGMTTLYLYFTDLTELLLAVLNPIMASAEESYVADIRPHWPCEDLSAHCLRFVEAYYAFWVKYSRILHMRNSFAENGDERMRQHRLDSSQPVIALLIRQMDGVQTDAPSQTAAMASVLWSGIERLTTVSTDITYANIIALGSEPRIRAMLAAEARILELGIRDARASART